MELIKRSKNITISMSELLHQSGSVANVCKSFQGARLDLKKLFCLSDQLSDVSQRERHFQITDTN